MTFITLQSVTDATVHIGIQVDFGAGTWTAPDNPKAIPLLGDNGGLMAVVIGGAAGTSFYLSDGATRVATLNLFGAGNAVGDTETGDFVSSDAAQSFNCTWLVTSVV